jgi:hypothetical protein
LFHEANRMMRLVGKVTAPALVASCLLISSLAQDQPTENAGNNKATKMKGRVLADVASLAFGAGVGPQYTRLIFGVESNDGRVQKVEPVKVAYAFFKSEGLLPDNFFDHSKLYELQVVRDPRCDESISSLSYENTVDETGRPLPPTNVLKLLEGVPKELLKPDLVLPCYILRPGQYRAIKQ